MSDVTVTTKTCPACAENVRAEAKVCRYCSFDFESGIRALAVPTKNSGKAIASLVLGLLFLYGIGSVLALVLGYQARQEIDASEGKLEGRGMATAGIVLGWIGVPASLLLWATLASL